MTSGQNLKCDRASVDPCHVFMTMTPRVRARKVSNRSPCYRNLSLKPGGYLRLQPRWIFRHLLDTYRVFRLLRPLLRERACRLNRPVGSQCLAKGAEVIHSPQTLSYYDAEKFAVTTAQNIQCHTCPGRACVRCQQLRMRCEYKTQDLEIKPAFSSLTKGPPSSGSSYITHFPLGDAPDRLRSPSLNVLPTVERKTHSVCNFCKGDFLLRRGIDVVNADAHDSAEDPVRWFAS